MNSKDFPYLGRMNDPVASAFVKGICGDEMEFYLYIREGIIEDIKFYTENGCDDTKTAGNTLASLADKKRITDALCISPKQIMDNVADLSVDGRHCAILATITFYKAIADYMLQD